jgi:carbamoyltransferase
VVLNTSFNGPGEPIVETPEDALRFLLNSELNALYIGGFRVTRASDEPNSSAG